MNIFSRLIKKRSPAAAPPEILTGSEPVFTPFSGNAYENDIYRGAVDAIARNAAKLKGAHVIMTTSGRNEGMSNINRLLQIRPNPYISAFDMLYRMVTHYFLYNNAFALLQRDERGYLTAIYPIKAASAEFLTDQSGRLYCKFMFGNGKDCTLPYSDIIHLRRNYNDNDLLGDRNTALTAALELAHTQNEGIISAIKNGANLKGILKYNQILSGEKLTEERNRFMAEYMQMDNNGGIVAIDQKAEYIPLKIEPSGVDDKQQKAAKEKIYTYLGITEKIVSSSYNEEEWAAFYESVIEPIAIQLSLEFTDKIFTQREQAFGSSILFEANRLQFASTETKTKLIKDIMPLGLLTINQSLEILNLPGVPDGDKRLVSLNYVNAEKADKYQLGSDDNNG